MTENIKLPVASVIGLGKLGSPMVACIAEKGFRVIGVDLDSRKVDAMNRGKAPVEETGLAAMLSANAKRISATTDIKQAVLDSDYTFIIVPTPSDDTGGFTIKYVLDACGPIAAALKEKNAWHLVAVTSTVLPGATGGPIRKILESQSEKKAGRDFGLCYNPELIALGSVIRDFQNPDLIIVGESDKKSGQALESFYARVCNNNPPVVRSNFVNAELTKIAINTYVTMKITYANQIARICEKIPGCDVDVVTSNVGLDSRIGRRYLKGATAFGGPCFPRDNAALAALARQVGTKALLAETTDRANQLEIDRIAALVREHSKSGGKAAVLGLSYKPDTGVIEESQGISLARDLAEHGTAVTCCDPMAIPAAREVLGQSVIYTTELSEAVKDADVVIIMTPWPVFGTLKPDNLKQNVTIIDCWRMLDRKKFNRGTTLLSVGIGRGQSNPEE